MIVAKKSTKKKTRRKKAALPPLVFIDTNILLDFYRYQNDAGPTLLKKLEDLKDRLIMTYQVEMEFKKNRQKVMLDSLSGLKNPDGNIQAPRFLADAKAMRGISTNRSKISAQIKKLHSQLDHALRNPQQKDPVYQSLQRLFHKTDDLNLNRDKDIRFNIRRLARKRFVLGYPPRKSSDTSIGDAVNWEWIVHCAMQSTAGIIIISRDSDYGATHRNESFLNDWLNQEFHARVAKGRPISLYSKLTDGLRAAAIEPTSEEVAAEDQIATLRPAIDDNAAEDRVTTSQPGSEVMLRAISEWLAAARKNDTGLRIPPTEPPQGTDRR